MNLALNRRNRCLTLCVKLRRKKFRQFVVTSISTLKNIFHVFPLVFCLTGVPECLFLPIFNDLLLYCFEADWPHSCIPKRMLDCQGLKRLLANKRKISKKGLYIILWRKTSNRVHKSYLLPMLPSPKNAYI
jgi:hypothetical protein